MDTVEIIKNAPKMATHYAVNRQDGHSVYAACNGSDFLVMPLTKFGVVLAFKCWDIYPLQEMKMKEKLKESIQTIGNFKSAIAKFDKEVSMDPTHAYVHGDRLNWLVSDALDDVELAYVTIKEIEDNTGVVFDWGLVGNE